MKRWRWPSDYRVKFAVNVECAVEPFMYVYRAALIRSRRASGQRATVNVSKWVGLETDWQTVRQKDEKSSDDDDDDVDDDRDDWSRSRDRLET